MQLAIELAETTSKAPPNEDSLPPEILKTIPWDGPPRFPRVSPERAKELLAQVRHDHDIQSYGLTN